MSHIVCGVVFPQKMPCELVENFDPEYPIVVGGMTNVEEKLGYVNVRIGPILVFFKFSFGCFSTVICHFSHL